MMSNNLIRTFLAISLPKEVATKKNMFYSTLENSPSNVHWVKNEHLHLTLKFLGHTPESAIPDIKKEIASVTSILKPFNIMINNTGCFPIPQRPRVLWMGVDGKIKPLVELHDMIQNKLNQLGFPRSEKEYFPHITVARINYPQKHTPDVSLFLNSSYDPIDLPVDRVQFFSSKLIPSGIVYSLLESFPLGEKF